MNIQLGDLRVRPADGCQCWTLERATQTKQGGIRWREWPCYKHDLEHILPELVDRAAQQLPDTFSLDASETDIITALNNLTDRIVNALHELENDFMVKSNEEPTSTPTTGMTMNRYAAERHPAAGGGE